MLKFLALVAVISVGFTVWCLVEAISADSHRVRRLPKVAWIVVILLLPLVGAGAWLLAGRPLAAAPATAAPGPDRVTRADASNPAQAAVDYSTRIRERAEEQRRRYEQQKNKDEDKDKDKPEAEAE